MTFDLSEFCFCEDEGTEDGSSGGLRLLVEKVASPSPLANQVYVLKLEKQAPNLSTRHKWVLRHHGVTSAQSGTICTELSTVTQFAPVGAWIGGDLTRDTSTARRFIYNEADMSWSAHLAGLLCRNQGTVFSFVLFHDAINHKKIFTFFRLESIDRDCLPPPLRMLASEIPAIKTQHGAKEKGSKTLKDLIKAMERI